MSLSTTIRGNLSPNPGSGPEPGGLDDEALLAICRYRPWEAWLDKYAQRLSAWLALILCLGLPLAVVLGKGLSPVWGLGSFAGIVACLLLSSLFYFVVIWAGLSIWLQGLVYARSLSAAREFRHRIGAGGFGRYCREAQALFDAPDPPDWILLRQRRPLRLDLSYWERIQLREGPAGIEGRIESRMLPAGKQLGYGYSGETLDARLSAIREHFFPGLPAGHYAAALAPETGAELLASLTALAPELGNANEGGPYKFAVLRREPRAQFIYSEKGGCCRQPGHAHSSEGMRRLEARLDALLGDTAEASCCPPGSRREDGRDNTVFCN